MRGLIFDFSFKLITVLVMSILFLKKVVKKEILLKTVEGVEDIILKSIVGVILLYLIFVRVFPMMQDIPCLIQKNYCTIEGIAQANSSSTNLATLGITLKEQTTQQEVYVVFGYRGD